MLSLSCCRERISRGRESRACVCSWYILRCYHGNAWGCFFSAPVCRVSDHHKASALRCCRAVACVMISEAQRKDQEKQLKREAQEHRRILLFAEIREPGEAGATATKLIIRGIIWKSKPGAHTPHFVFQTGSGYPLLILGENPGRTAGGEIIDRMDFSRKSPQITGAISAERHKESPVCIFSYTAGRHISDQASLSWSRCIASAMARITN